MGKSSIDQALNRNLHSLLRDRFLAMVGLKRVSALDYNGKKYKTLKKHLEAVFSFWPKSTKKTSKSSLKAKEQMR